MGDTFFILLLCFLMILWLRSQISDKLYHLSRKIDDLTREIKELKLKPQSGIAAKEEVKKEPVQPPVKPVTTEIETPAPEDTEPAKEPVEEMEPVYFEPAPRPPVIHSKPAFTASPRPPKKTFFETHPDLENFIGENLINKIGIGVLVLGIAFFVKYAIDQNWINAIGRVSIGVLCGGLLIGIAHRLRKSFKAFSSVLVAGGLAVLYFTITIAFQQYGLFSQTAAFAIMIVITAFAVIMSIAYDRMELAVIAIVGGFATPFMVSTGEGNYVVLFTYLMILNSGMLTLAYFKKWNLVNIVCYIFTIILYGGWLSTKVLNTPSAPYVGALLFATLFYFTFFLMNIIYNIREKAKFIAIEISLLLSNTFLYYAAGMIVLARIHGGDYQGLFTATLGIFNCVFAFLLYKNDRADRNLVFMLIGLVLTFISLAAPVQLKGNHITLFWSVESVLLLWLSQKSGIRLFKDASAAVLLLMLISLGMDWQQLYFTQSSSSLPLILNKAFITSMVAVICIGANLILAKKEQQRFIVFNTIPISVYTNFLYILFCISIYAGILNELNYQLEQYVDYYQNRNIILACYNYSFLAVLLFATRNVLSAVLKNFLSLLSSIALLLYLVSLNDDVVSVRDSYLNGHPSYLGFFLAHYFFVAVLWYILYLTWKRLTIVPDAKRSNIIPWAFAFIGVYIASAELDHLVVITGYHEGAGIYSLVDQNHKIGYPILWGVCSFIMMYAGMKKKTRHLRVMALSLLGVTLIKLFTWDIRGVSEGGKIGAFISLGVLLLVVSFMYQRLKKLLLDDGHKTETEEAKPDTV